LTRKRTRTRWRVVGRRKKRDAIASFPESDWSQHYMTLALIGLKEASTILRCKRFKAAVVISGLFEQATLLATFASSF